jgi:hypothetical protein
VFEKQNSSKPLALETGVGGFQVFRFSGFAVSKFQGCQETQVSDGKDVKAEPPRLENLNS